MTNNMAGIIKNRHRLKTKDIKDIEEEINNIFSDVNFDKKSSIEIADVDQYKIIFIENKPCFMFYNDEIFFTLQGLLFFHPKQNFVVVDMGAVKFVTEGADVMTPGIVDADQNIKEDQQVWICDEKNRKPLAVGIAIIDGSRMINEDKGRAIKTIHWVGDRLWKFTAKSL